MTCTGSTVFCVAESIEDDREECLHLKQSAGSFEAHVVTLRENGLDHYSACSKCIVISIVYLKI